MSEETFTLPLSNKDFDIDMNLINKKTKPKTLVIFFNPGCGHCVNFKPTYEELAKKFNNDPSKNITIATVNTGENRDLMQRINDKQKDFEVQGVPTVISYYGGQYYSTYAPGDKGNHPYRSLEDVIEYVTGIGSAEITYKK
jgi:thiol-disulfide isomerase/thioredoxin